MARTLPLVMTLTADTHDGVSKRASVGERPRRIWVVDYDSDGDDLALQM